VAFAPNVAQVTMPPGRDWPNVTATIGSSPQLPQAKTAKPKRHRPC